MPIPPKLLGYILLVVMFPLAFSGLMATPNEYRAMGIDAIDCDGPISVLIFAVPTLIVYEIAGLIFLRHCRRLVLLVSGVMCALICAGLIWNIGNAVAEQWKSSTEQDCRRGL